MTAAPGAVTALDLRKTYRGGVLALDGLSFAVPAGTVFALLGPNGAGKTTATRILTTLSRPDRGSATIAGLDVARQPARVRSVIGSVSQANASVPLLTGRENLTLQGRLHGMRSRDLRPRVTDLLSQFGLSDAAGRPARTYSGGMRRRLDVAMALIHRPAVLFLDEPTTGLDPEVRAGLWAELRSLVAGQGTTIVLTTHYLTEADEFAGQVAIIDRGSVVATGTPAELKAALGGDAVLIDLADAAQSGLAGRALALVPQVRQVTAAGTALRARVGDGPRALAAVLASLEDGGVAVAAASLTRPSLDDVYFHHTGRTFRQAEGVPAA